MSPAPEWSRDCYHLHRCYRVARRLVIQSVAQSPAQTLELVESKTVGDGANIQIYQPPEAR